MIDFTFWFCWYDTERLSSSKCASIIYPFGETLNELEPMFSNFYVPGNSRKKSLINSFIWKEDKIEEHLRKSIRKTDFDDMGLPKIPYTLGLYKEDQFSNHVSLLICMGVSKVGMYSSVLTLDYCDTFKLADNTIYEIIKLIISTFKPDRGIFTSRDLRSRLTESFEYKIGWITYTKNEIKKVSKSFQVDPLTNSEGYLIYLDDQNSGFYNPEKIDTILDLQTILK